MMKGGFRSAVSMGVLVAATMATSVAAQTAPAGAAGSGDLQPTPSSGQATAAPDAADQSTTGGDIIVTGFRRSLAQGLELKRDAIGVRDSIVAEDIGKFPEANVADSLQRIPGVFLTRDGLSNEGQRISIRGLGSEFVETTINGAPVHTTSSQNVGGATRDFNYDVFPSELFGRVDVYKTPLASLEEGGIGGNVDLQTPRPFDSKERVIRYSAQGVYDTQSRATKPRGSLLVSDTWGNFGALFGVAYAGNENRRSGFQSTGGYNSSALGSTAYATPPNPSSGTFPFQLDLSNPNANFGSYTASQIANAYLPRFYRVYTSDDQRNRLGFVGSLQYKSSRFDVSLDGIYSRLRDSADEYTFGVAVRNSRTVPGTKSAPGVGTNSGIYPIDPHIDQYGNLYGTFGNTSFITESYYRDAETRFGYGILRATWDVSESIKISGNADLTDSRAVYSANRIYTNIFGVQSTFDPTVNVTYPTISSPVDFTNPASFSSPQLGFSLQHENDYQKNARLAADWKVVDDGDTRFTVQFGGNYTSSIKQISSQDGSAIASSRTLPNGQTFSTLNVASYMNPYIQYGTLDNGGNSGYPSNFATFPRSFVMDFLGANSANNAASIQQNSAFRANEIVKAAFLEFNFAMPIFGRQLRGDAGVRYASTLTLINNYLSAGGGRFAPNFSRGQYENWLPSVSLAYDITPKLVLRGSAGKTVTRAALSIIAGSIVVPNPYNTQITVGNPSIAPQESSQYDTALEWYFTRGGLLSVGLFQKNLSNIAKPVVTTVPFSATGLPSSAFNSLSVIGTPNATLPANLPITETTYINGNFLNLKGLEAIYQQNFTFLPKPFDGLGFTGSFTIIGRDGNYFVTSKGTKVSIAPVPDYSYSLTGFYEKGPFTIRGSYNYRAKTGVTSANSGNDQIPYVAPQGFLDGTVSYKINKYVEVRVDVLNLTNENLYTYYVNPDQPAGNGSTRRDNSYFNGRTISFGIRGKF